MWAVVQRTRKRNEAMESSKNEKNIFIKMEKKERKKNENPKCLRIEKTVQVTVFSTKS